MKNTLKLHLYGYTVQGTDRRDSNSSFEDYIVLSDLDGPNPADRVNKIINLYSAQGYEVDKNGVFPDDNLENSCWKESPGVEVNLDFIELYRQNRAGTHCAANTSET